MPEDGKHAGSDFCKIFRKCGPVIKLYEQRNRIDKHPHGIVFTLPATIQYRSTDKKAFRIHLDTIHTDG